MHIWYADSALYMLSVHLVLCYGATYDQALGLYNSKFGNITKAILVRPLRNQSQAIVVTVNFNPISIMQVDEVVQKFTCSGYMSLLWTDELIPWIPEEHGNLTEISPDIHDIWKPLVLLKNSLDSLYAFDDQQSTFYVKYNGYSQWYPGGIFSTSCTLDLVKYPFDIQKCKLQFQAMRYKNNQLEFQAEQPDMNLFYLYSNSAWELLRATVKTKIDFENTFHATACAEFTFTLKRRSSFIMYTIILPEMFISFLNMLVFFIPVESGEKISYGTTVLLSQAVFMTILMNQLPETSITVPHVTIYMFSLISIAVFSVLISIIIVYLHRVEKEDAFQRSEKSSSHGSVKSHHELQTGNDVKACNRDNLLYNNTFRATVESPSGKRRQAIKCLNSCSCISCFLGWISVTLWYFICVRM